MTTKTYTAAPLRCPNLPKPGTVSSGSYWIHAWMGSEARLQAVEETIAYINELFLNITVNRQVLIRGLTAARTTLRYAAQDDLDMVIDRGMLLCAHADTTLVAA